MRSIFPLFLLLFTFANNVWSEVATWRFGEDITIKVPVSTKTYGRARTVILYPPFGAIASVVTQADKSDLDYQIEQGKNAMDIQVLNPSIDTYVRILDSNNNLVKLRVIAADKTDNIDGTFVLMQGQSPNKTITTYANSNGIEMTESSSSSGGLIDTYSAVAVMVKHIYGDAPRDDVRSSPVFTMKEDGSQIPGKILVQDDDYTARLLKVWQSPNLKALLVQINTPDEKPRRIPYGKLKVGNSFAQLNDDGYDLEDPNGSLLLTPGYPITMIFFTR